MNLEKLKDEGDRSSSGSNWKFVAKDITVSKTKESAGCFTRKENEEIDFDFFESKIAAAFERREAFFADTETTAFRVFNGEGDGIGGLTIDYFDGYFMVSWYSAGIYSLKHHVYGVIDKIVDIKVFIKKTI